MAKRKKRIAAPLQFNANGEYVKKMVAATVALETSDVGVAALEPFIFGWKACNIGEMLPAHGDKVRAMICTAVAKKRGTKYDDAAKKRDKSRVSNTRTALKIHDWICVKNGALATVLKKIDTLTFEKIIAVVHHMKGTPTIDSMWDAKRTDAPSLKTLTAIVNATKGRKSKSGKRKRKGVMGMPSDADRSLDYVIKSAKAFDKMHGKAMGTHRAVVTKTIANLTALMPAAKKIMSQQAKAEAEAALKAKLAK